MKTTTVRIMFLICLLLGSGVMFVSNSTWAQTTTLKMKEGEMSVLSVLSLQRVAIGDPAIADISIISDKELMLMARKAGQTSLIIWDGAGQREFVVEVASKIIMDEVVDRIKQLLKANDLEAIKVIQEGEGIFLIGELPDSSDIEQINRIISSFPGVVNLVREASVKPLVQLNVEVMEIKLSASKTLGISWVESFPVYYGLSDVVWKQEGQRETDMTYTLGFAGRTHLATLNFLMEEGDARLLAKPNLVVASGKEGKILVGGEVPVLSATQEGTLPTIQWKAYGVNLNVRPTVLKNGYINIAMLAEVSDLSQTEVQIEGTTVHGVDTRSSETEVILKNGETMIIGGLLKTRTSETVQKVPILGDIPLLKKLFRSTDRSDEEIDLVIFITPRIIERGNGKTGDNVIDLQPLGHKKNSDGGEGWLRTQE